MGSVLRTPFVMGKSVVNRYAGGSTVQFFDETREKWFGHEIHPYEEDLDDSQFTVDWASAHTIIKMSGQAPVISLSTLYCHGGGMNGNRMGIDGWPVSWPEYKILDSEDGDLPYNG